MTDPAAAQSTSAAEPRDVYQDNKLLFAVGAQKPIFLVPDVFMGQLKIGIREYYLRSSDNKDEDELGTENHDLLRNADVRPYYQPTKRGVSLSETEFDRLITKADQARRVIRRLKTRLDKGYQQREQEELKKKEEEEKKAGKKNEETLPGLERGGDTDEEEEEEEEEQEEIPPKKQRGRRPAGKASAAETRPLLKKK